MELSNKTRAIISRIFLLLIFSLISWGAPSQASHRLYDLHLKGTRSWIRVEWKRHGKITDSIYLFWSTGKKMPRHPSAVLSGKKKRYYISDVQDETTYYVWVKPASSSRHRQTLSGEVVAKTRWSLDSGELTKLSPASSIAVPKGMKLYWHDEFNDLLLNRNKWFPTYYSSIDYLRKEAFEDLTPDHLPKAAYHLNGQYIDLFVNDSLPKRAFFSNGKKISSIQTYDWASDVNLLNNSLGGYFEVRVRRGSTGKVEGLNTAFWFDSPGPDLSYYLPQGAMKDGTKGIRPKGQLFEIDMFENLDAQFVMHGRVDSVGHFIHNLATDIAHKYKPVKYRPGKKWVTFGLLWTPTSIKHYINGRLIKSYDNKHHVFSPNHFMNVLLGSYGKGGSVHLQVDYIRYYRWPVSSQNELPNPGFEANSTRLPWQGTGTLSKREKKDGHYGVLLKPHQYIEQYIYLDNNQKYELTYWTKGNSELQAQVSNIEEVTGEKENMVKNHNEGVRTFSKEKRNFRTGKLHEGQKKTVKIRFVNIGDKKVYIDDVKIRRKDHEGMSRSIVE